MMSKLLTLQMDNKKNYIFLVQWYKILCKVEMNVRNAVTKLHARRLRFLEAEERKCTTKKR